MIEAIKFNNKEYYNADDVYKLEPQSFVGCSKTSRLIIIRKKLKDEDYVYARYDKLSNSWISSDAMYRLAKVLLTKTWVLANLIKYKENKSEEDHKIEDMIAPPILLLEDHEKFIDTDNNILEIEIRGEKVIDKIYFKVKDISEKFKISNIHITLTCSTSSFKRNIHFKSFKIILCTTLSTPKGNPKGNPNSLFLTFKGLMKLLYVSHSKNADHFQDWANNILFTHQLAPQETKDALASSLIGVNPQTIKNVFKVNSSKTPCVYLYLIGNANAILKNNIYNDNDDILCKYGCTDDLERRCTEHNKKFSKDFNVNIELICFSIIEAKYIFEAENNVKQYFKANIVEVNGMKELIVINKKDLTHIKQHYKIIQNSYIGRYEEMQNKIVLLEKEIIELNHKILLKDKENELLSEKYKNELKDKENELLGEKYKNELKDKDIELLQFKLKFLDISTIKVHKTKLIT